MVHAKHCVPYPKQPCIVHEVNMWCPLSYTSPSVRKQCPRGETTSKPYKPTFLATRFMAVLQPSGYSVFHGRDTPIQLSLP